MYGDWHVLNSICLFPIHVIAICSSQCRYCQASIFWLHWRTRTASLIPSPSSTTWERLLFLTHFEYCKDNCMCLAGNLDARVTGVKRLMLPSVQSTGMAWRAQHSISPFLPGSITFFDERNSTQKEWVIWKYSLCFSFQYILLATQTLQNQQQLQ